MQDVFARFYVDLRSSGSRRAMIEQLAEDGLVTFDGAASRDAVLGILRSIATIRPHRDGAGDGVTVLVGSDRARQDPSYAGFGRGELFPHTDGTSVREPPGLVMVVCAKPSGAGGESLVADGRDIFDALRSVSAEAVRALSAPGCASFGGGRAVYRGAVFEPTTPGRVAIRFRHDELARFTSPAALALPELLDAIYERLLRFRLDAGEGYIAQNGRWLHGRTTFAGPRTMYRVLGDPLPRAVLGGRILFGFTPVTARSLARA